MSDERVIEIGNRLINLMKEEIMCKEDVADFMEALSRLIVSLALSISNNNKKKSHEIIDVINTEMKQLIELREK